MIHFCPDELQAIQAMFPFAQEIIFKISIWWNSK